MKNGVLWLDTTTTWLGMGEVIRLPLTHRIAYTDGEGENFVTDGYGGEWETRDRDEANDYMVWLSENWPGMLFWIVVGR